MHSWLVCDSSHTSWKVFIWIHPWKIKIKWEDALVFIFNIASDNRKLRERGTESVESKIPCHLLDILWDYPVWTESSTFGDLWHRRPLVIIFVHEHGKLRFVLTLKRWNKRAHIFSYVTGMNRFYRILPLMNITCSWFEN